MTQHQAEPSNVGRRTFLAGAGAVGAGLVANALVPGTAGAATGSAAPRAAAARWQPDTDSARFTVAVLPDTQYLFDDASIHPQPLEATVEHVLAAQQAENIVFLAHLGDLTQNGLAHEMTAIGRALAPLDRAGAAYSVLAGNHDIDGSKDDTRGRSPYLDIFGPHRFHRAPSFLEASPGGYNSAHLFRAAGRDWLLLAMDWRPSATGIAWAKTVLARHPHAAAILTTHELVDTDATGAGVLSGQGEQLWAELINSSDQIFLTVNGHFWPSGRLQRTNAAGHTVAMHLANYQQRYYGGAGMIRLYHFDLDRNAIDVETVSPWILGQSEPNLLAAREIELSGDADRFTETVDFEQRFAGFAPVPVRPSRPADRVLLPGTLAYWRFDALDGDRLPDLSGQGNDLNVMRPTGSRPDALTVVDAFHPDQPAHSSARFVGGRTAGAYLQTGTTAPLNAERFTDGYTIETFFNLPADWTDGSHSWSSMFSRWGTASQAGKSGDFPDEPLVTLSISGSLELQWCVYPTNLDTSVTNWGHELQLEQWWHVAVVNDRQHTRLYVDGCEVARNPATVNRGLTSLGKPWMLGGYSYGTELGQIHYGLLGDTRIVGRALAPEQFLIG